MNRFQRIQPGARQISSAGYNAAMEAVEGLTRSSGLGAVGPWGLALEIRTPANPIFIPALITGDGATPGSYNWTGQIWDASLNGGSGGWNTGPDSSTNLGYALEMSGLDAVAVNQTVTLRGEYDVSGNLVLLFDSPIKWIWVKLTGNSSISTNRWYYGGTRQVRTATGFADFSPALSIIAGSGTSLLNSMETFNTGGSTPGPQGNGVNHTTVTNGGNFPNGFVMQAMNTGSPVVQAFRERLSDGTRVWTLQSPNADDGTC